MGREKTNTEYKNVCAYILGKYGIDLENEHDLTKCVNNNLEFILALKTWNKHIESSDTIFHGAKVYFNEIISNIYYATILTVLGLKTPSLVMIRRAQENILSFIYYSEHPVEYHKKEIDEQSKNFNGFKELKEYIQNYPFSSKYNISGSELQKLCVEILNAWTEQYKELSNFVHGSNTKYFDSISYLDEVPFNKDDIDFILQHIQKLQSVINVLLIIFFFDMYSSFNEEDEKTIIRSSIKGKSRYKEKIVKVFKEI